MDKGNTQAAVFLDRDGVIIEDTGYIDSCSRVTTIPGIDEIIRSFNEHGFKVIVVTNQAGVARGYFTEETVHKINGYIQKQLEDRGARIDGIYYCPHHKEGIVPEYTKECYCRKPNPGMLEKAANDFGIDLMKSFLLGDKMSDIEAGFRAGCRTVYLVSEFSPNDTTTSSEKPDHTAMSLSDAGKWIIEQKKAEERR
ncbi:MAG: HAD family hydrolase [Dehalococcoidales bacterium]|nr:HAD family hydrolase [Dehalococcoidales bacterium]